MSYNTVFVMAAFIPEALVQADKASVGKDT
jgi:hypothetical protein